MLPRTFTLSLLAGCGSLPLNEAPPDPDALFPVDYEEASEETDVPEELLLALSYAETRLA